MNSLKDRLDAISAGEIIDTGSFALPVFNDTEMLTCIDALRQLFMSSQEKTGVKTRLRPPTNAIHVIL